MANDKKLTVTLKRSSIGCFKKQKATVKGLGLGRVGSSSELEDTPSVRGMINKIQHMVEVS